MQVLAAATMHTGAMSSRTPADLAKEVHRQFPVLREGRAAAAEYAKALDRARVIPMVDGSVDEPLQASKPAEVSSRLVAAIFGQAKRSPLPVPEARPASWGDWQAVSNAQPRA